MLSVEAIRFVVIPRSNFSRDATKLSYITNINFMRKQIFERRL